MTDQKVHKKLKKQLKKLEIENQLDLINLMIGVVSRRISVNDIELKNWIEKSIDGLSLDYQRMDDESISLLSEYDLSMFVSEADSFLGTLKRTETGSFYTPIKWVKYMTKIAICDWLQDEAGLKVEQSTPVITLLSQRYDIGQVYSLQKSLNELNVNVQDLKLIAQKLKQIQIIDIACGAGAFLLETVELLTTMYTNIDVMIEKSPETLKNGSIKSSVQPSTCESTELDYKTNARTILSNSVTGIDLQAEPLVVYTLCLLWRYASNEHWKLSPFVIQGSSLTEEMYSNNRLTSILQNGGFDIVLGNPPYLGEKGNIPTFKEIRKTPFGEKYYEGKMDLSYFFTLKSLELLKPNGNLTYLTTNYFITADGAVKYRETLREKAWFSHILNFNSYPVFKDALGQHNMIYMLKQNSGNYTNRKVTVKYVLNEAYLDKVELCSDEIFLSEHDKKYLNEYTCDPDGLFTIDGTISILSDNNHKSIIDAYKNFCDIKLKDVFNINQGIVSGADQVSGLMMRSKIPKKDIEKYSLNKGDPIFVFANDDPNLRGIEEDIMRPFYKNSDIGAYSIKPRTHRKIIYLDGYENQVETSHPKVIKHLEKFRSVLEARREVKTGTRPWYALQWPRKPDVFEGAKIVVPQRCKINRFAYTMKSFYCSADVYYFKEKEIKAVHAWPNKFDDNAWMYYLGILNSSMLYLWLYHNGKRKGELLELYAKPLLDTAVPCYRAFEWQKAISEQVREILETDDVSHIESNRQAIDTLIFEAMSLKKNEIEVVAGFLKKHKKS